MYQNAKQLSFRHVGRAKRSRNISYKLNRSPFNFAQGDEITIVLYIALPIAKPYSKKHTPFSQKGRTLSRKSMHPFYGKVSME